MRTLKSPAPNEKAELERLYRSRVHEYFEKALAEAKDALVACPSGEMQTRQGQAQALQHIVELIENGKR